jgi:hypothetical protein
MEEDKVGIVDVLLEPCGMDEQGLTRTGHCGADDEKGKYQQEFRFHRVLLRP